MVEETRSRADGGDDRVLEGLAHLQVAARELIAAARAILDVAEELVDDPRTVTVITDAVGAVVRSAAQAGRKAAGVTGVSAGDGGAEPTGVERIKVN